MSAVHDQAVAMEATSDEAKSEAQRSVKGRAVKTVLPLPDLEVAKSAVLNSLSCPDAQRGYRHAIDERYRFYSYGDCMLIR